MNLLGALLALTLASTGIQLPPVGVADYQLGGAYPPAADVQVVARDSTDKPAPGLYNICYINGFQSQPGTHWPANLLVRKNGKPIVDPGWPDEHIFDISTRANRAKLVARLTPTIRGCARNGFQAVEFDNLDSYTRSHHAFGSKAAIAFATSLVRVAHASGLAAAQKNTIDLAKVGKSKIGFDFAITEQCVRYRECAGFTRVYGQHVIDIEYTDDLPTPFANVCASSARPTSVMLRDHDLVPAGKKQHVNEHC